MGTTTTNQHSQAINCQVCKKLYSHECDWRQGRCPHHAPTVLTKRFLFVAICLIIVTCVTFYGYK